MKIQEKKVKIRDLVNNYTNREDEGVTALNGKLNIRPKYQREFIYDDRKQKLVIDTVFKGFPLNTMYWVKNKDGDYEILDGQQRTMSICEYYNDGKSGNFSYKDKFFQNWAKDIQDKFLNYELTIYICEGSDSERLDWFRTINIAGEPLTDQELRNANYTGSWLTSAKAYFSKKNNCLAELRYGSYLNGDRSRQVYLETALNWLTDFLRFDGEDPISEYMGKHQNDKDAKELIDYFNKVMNWVISIFSEKMRKEMKGLPWGIYYNKYHSKKFNPSDIQKFVTKYMDDDEIINKKGIYEFLLSGNDKFLNLRQFTNIDKRKMYDRQKGICPICKKHFSIEEMDAHHIKQWAEGGKTEIENGIMLCRDCHHKKTLGLHKNN